MSTLSLEETANISREGRRRYKYQWIFWNRHSFTSFWWLLLYHNICCKCTSFYINICGLLLFVRTWFKPKHKRFVRCRSTITNLILFQTNDSWSDRVTSMDSIQCVLNKMNSMWISEKVNLRKSSEIMWILIFFQQALFSMEV